VIPGWGQGVAGALERIRTLFRVGVLLNHEAIRPRIRPHPLRHSVRHSVPFLPVHRAFSASFRAVRFLLIIWRPCRVQAPRRLAPTGPT